MAKYKPLVSQHLENISGKALEDYQSIIREYVRHRYGVYALYRQDRLYYVGLASNLRARLNHHLRDKHRGKWDRFSVYLTMGDSHLKELESLILRIVRPKGNSQVGTFIKSETLKSRLARDIRQYHRHTIDELLGRIRRGLADNPERQSRSAEGQRKAPPLSKFTKRFGRSLRLRVVFKGKEYRARIRRDGRIRYKRKTYNSPSLAACAVRKKPTNGWTFWSYERAPQDWVRLRELRH